ncbi:MAG: tetratricopeptide repeat protein [Saprospiraceae bacterium]|nr:tetratricopeptide repeat protein [Candidatus Defluviibacterium haderslevense]MBK7244683.1 tetratricopeptide repeat protein [Candidatus Defluviibacterium haderslevense]
MKNFLRLISVLLLCGVLFNAAQAQKQQKIDSLMNLLKTAKEDTNKVNHLYNLGRELMYSNPDTAMILGNQALSLSEKATSKKHIADSYHIIALAYFLKGNYPSSLENNFKALALREELADKSGVAKSLGNIGNSYMHQADYPKALDYYFKGLKMLEELADKMGIAIHLGNIGNAYHYQSNYTKALDYYFEALKMNEKIGNKNGIAMWLGNIGVVYWKQKEYPKALDNYFKALKMHEEFGNKQGIETCLANIGSVYSDQGDKPKALDYSFKALKIAEELGHRDGISAHLGNIGFVYHVQKNYPKALDYSFKALKIAEELGDKNGIAIHLSRIGCVYTETGKFAESEEYLKKAIAIYDSIGVMDFLRQSEESLSHLYDTTGRYKLALEHYKKAMVLKDTLFNIEKSKEITRNEMNYEFEKKESATKAEYDKQMAVADVEIKRQKLLKNFLIGGLVMLLLLSYFIYNNFRAASKLKLQNIRNKIASDLHDDVGSTLNSISVYSEVAKQKSPAVVDELEQIGEASRKIIEVMSDIVWTINPKNDTFENIISRMSTLAYNLLKAKNIEHTFQADESLDETKLSLESRRNFYLIFKETLNNLVKYSQATRASITLTSENALVKLAVRDNGIGFDVAQTSKGNGLLNMKARADEMKAQLNIESEKGSGTNIELIFKA